ncbi:MAG: IPExxxVDY family protein [Salinivirgaceae bacterium]|nr:IPExxxVDY family protein [Salinivirgaceae bacterium]
MAKKKLISEPDSYPDLNVMGLSTQIKDYRLAFLMNNLLGFNLKKLDDLPVFFTRINAVVYYPIFTFYDVEQRLYYCLIGNNNKQQPMIHSIKHADYLIFIKGYPEQTKMEELTSNLRAHNEIQLAFNAEKEKIKNLEDIMTDLELHLANFE